MMRRCRQRLRCGFTLIEMLVTITIVAVLAAVVLPQFTDDGRLRLSSVSSVLISDIELAQMMTITHPDRPVLVWFDTQDTYWLAYVDTPKVPIVRPGTTQPYVVQLGTGRMTSAAGPMPMHIHFTNANAEQFLRFDAQGGLDDFLSDPQLYIHIVNAKGAETHRLTLQIAPTTGTITEVSG